MGLFLCSLVIFVKKEFKVQNPNWSQIRTEQITREDKELLFVEANNAIWVIDTRYSRPFRLSLDSSWCIGRDQNNWASDVESLWLFSFNLRQSWKNNSDIAHNDGCVFVKKFISLQLSELQYTLDAPNLSELKWRTLLWLCYLALLDAIGFLLDVALVVPLIWKSVCFAFHSIAIIEL